MISYSEEEVVPEEFIFAAEWESPSGSVKSVAGFSAGRVEGTGCIRFMEN